MLLRLTALLLQPVHAILTVGFLSSGQEERTVLEECIANTTVKLRTIPSCTNYNGLDNMVRLHYVYKVDAFLGAPCDEESTAVSRLAFRWGTPYLSTSVQLSHTRENGTISVMPDFHQGLALALAAMLQELEVPQIVVVYSDNFEGLTNELVHAFGGQAKLILYPSEINYAWSDHIHEVVLLLNTTDRIRMLRHLLENNSQTSKFIAYDDGW
ncbi:hypothetical protein Q1695_006155 [Nippostrongylus brasiliensis]|nr:hypothetical protein Q1695_006155 [Nippostrongylus brasiliensis]